MRLYFQSVRLGTRVGVLLVASLALANVGIAAAAPLNYDEAVDGDLEGIITALIPTLVLDTGTNSIVGTSSWGGTGTPADFDGFNFSIDPGQQLSSIQLQWTVTDWNQAGGLYFSTRYQLLNTSTNTLLGDRDLRLVSNSVFLPADTSPTLLLFGLPLGPGDYRLGQVGMGNSGSFDYQLQLDVAPVPLPAAAWLLLSGLGGLGFAARRRTA